MTFIPPQATNPAQYYNQQPSSLFEYYADPNDPSQIVTTGQGGYPSIRYPEPTNIGTVSESTGGHQSGTGIVDRQIGNFNRGKLGFPTLEEYTANPGAYVSSEVRIDTSLDEDNVIDAYGRPTLTDNTKITNNYNKVDLVQHAIKNKLNFDNLNFSTHRDLNFKPYGKFKAPKKKKNLLASLTSSEMAFLAKGIGEALGGAFNAFSDAQSGTTFNMEKQFPSAGLYRGDYA